MKLDAGVLRTWASIGDAVPRSRPGPTPDWAAVDRMIEAVRPKLAAEAGRLKALLFESRKQLVPLEDPFDLDLGLHRWLDEEREEAYSDWLEWVVAQARTPERVYKLFGLGRPPNDLLASHDPKIERECCVPHGHDEHEGRLDLVIRFGSQALIVVELKMGSADVADTAKHRGYCRWIAEQEHSHKHSVLLATSGKGSNYEGFSFVSWENVCIELRRLAVDISKNNRMMAAALILAFVAAVEQNLLGFSADLVRRICEGRAAFFNPHIVEYLGRCVRP